MKRQGGSNMDATVSRNLDLAQDLAGLFRCVRVVPPWRVEQAVCVSRAGPGQVVSWFCVSAWISGGS
jgi:hypothetical protein